MMSNIGHILYNMKIEETLLSDREKVNIPLILDYLIYLKIQDLKYYYYDLFYFLNWNLNDFHYLCMDAYFL